MTIALAMYEKSYAHIRERLDALKLDVAVTTFDGEGRFNVGGGKVGPETVEADYLWYNQNISADGILPKVFQMTLAMKRVGVLQTFNAGLDAPAYKQISQKGVRICNSSAQGVAIAEYIMAQALAITHPVAEQRQLQADRTWKITPFRELSRTHWLIFGYGPIGQATAKRAKAFGAKISVVRRSPKTDACVDRAGTLADARTFAGDADVIVLASSLNAQTRGFCNADFFAGVKPGAILINISRGGVIDDAALIQALDDGKLSTAVLDVFHKEPLPTDDPLWSHPKVRLTAHTSFAGDGVRPRWDGLFLENIQRFAKGEPLAFEVNPADLA